MEDIFDGDCYASTYQSNGQCHIYQELPETNQRMRSKSMAASHDALNRPKPALALRITASSASISRFPYTMPNTPALSVFDLEAKPSFQGFPYTESTPSVSYSDRKMSSMASSSLKDSRPSGSSFLEKPSISTLPYTPEDTPVSFLYKKMVAKKFIRVENRLTMCIQVRTLMIVPPIYLCSSSHIMV